MSNGGVRIQQVANFSFFLPRMLDVPYHDAGDTNIRHLFFLPVLSFPFPFLIVIAIAMAIVILILIDLSHWSARWLAPTPS